MNRRALLVILLVAAMVGSIFVFPGAPVVQPAAAQGTPFILNVGVQDEMKTRNVLRANFFITDVWTADVHNPLLETTAQTHPDTQDLLPYVMAGTDVNGDGDLTTDEIGKFQPITGQPSEWVAFFDLGNGTSRMKFHDGTPVEMADVLFTYHLEGLSAVIGSARFVKDRAGEALSNYTDTRWLWINPVPLGTWLGLSPSSTQFALRFRQTGANAQFSRDTLQTTFLPAYFWQGTGVRKQDGQIIATGVHPDFGWAINPDASVGPYLNGVPSAGLTTQTATTFEGIAIPAGTALNAFDLKTASEWDAQDGDVIGSGSFKFTTWVSGSFARVDKNPDYFIPSPEVAQATITAGLRQPRLDAMVYRLYKNVQASIFALQAGTIDFTDWNVPPDFVGPLLSDPNVGLKTSADAGFFYLTFNFRRLPFGYQNPSEGSNVPGNDIGKPFREAVAMASDKRLIVTSLLQNFGVPGHTVVSPTNTLYYNDSAPRYPFDLDQARSVLDAAYGVWPGGTCAQDGTGCRSLPGKGTALIEMLTPQADYDPIRASAGTLIAQNLRSIGVNIVSKPTSFGQIVVLERDLQDFDMYILGWSLTGFIVPSYIEDFFHSRYTSLGQSNSEGYVNNVLDRVIDDALAAAPGTPEAIRLWKWAQAIVAGDQAYNVLFYRTNIFAFRQDRIDPASWRTDIGGDIFFYWSWIRLDPAPPGLISASASAPSAVSSGSTASVTVTVRDPDLNRLAGATADFSVTGGGSVAPTTATTDSNGQATTTFTAPTLGPTDTPVSTFIQVRATHPSYGAANPVNVVITTFPPGQKFLAVKADPLFGNVVPEESATVLDILVTDETTGPAEGASVVLTVSPAGTGLLSESTYTTDATGRKQVTFNAPEVSKDETYTITISVSRAGAQGNTTQIITVLDVPPVTPPGLGSEVLLIVGAVVGVGAAGGGYFFVRRRRMKKK